MVSLALITMILGTRKEEEEKRSKRKSSKEHGKSLSLVTKGLSGIGEDLISLYVSRIEYLAIVSGLKLENLEGYECGVVGVFIAPTTKLAVW